MGEGWEQDVVSNHMGCAAHPVLYQKCQETGLGGLQSRLGLQIKKILKKSLGH